MPRAFDISMEAAPDMPIYPGDPAVEIQRVLSISRGDAANVSRYCLGAHTGTHVDAPCHFVDGEASIEMLDLGLLVGEALVVDVTDVEGQITLDDLERRPELEGQQKILFKTKNSEVEDETQGFRKDYVAIASDAAQYLVKLGVRTVGIDYLSVEPFEQEGFPTHKMLLENGIIPIEGLDLHGIEPGEYLLVCLPWKVRGGDGGPARAILIEIEEDDGVE